MTAPRSLSVEFVLEAAAEAGASAELKGAGVFRDDEDGADGCDDAGIDADWRN